MKYVTIIALSLFIAGISMVAFAEEPAQMKQQEQKIESQAAEEGQKIQEAKDFPSTLITGAGCHGRRQSLDGQRGFLD